MSVVLKKKYLFIAHVTCPTSVDKKGSDPCWQGPTLMEPLSFYDTLSQPKASNLLKT